MADRYNIVIISSQCRQTQAAYKLHCMQPCNHIAYPGWAGPSDPQVAHFETKHSAVLLAVGRRLLHMSLCGAAIAWIIAIRFVTNAFRDRSWCFVDDYFNNSKPTPAIRLHISKSTRWSGFLGLLYVSKPYQEAIESASMLVYNRPVLSVLFHTSCFLFSGFYKNISKMFFSNHPRVTANICAKYHHMWSARFRGHRSEQNSRIF